MGMGIGLVCGPSTLSEDGSFEPGSTSAVNMMGHRLVISSFYAIEHTFTTYCLDRKCDPATCFTPYEYVTDSCDGFQWDASLDRYWRNHSLLGVEIFPPKVDNKIDCIEEQACLGM
jgi:hypothetical protein